MDEQAHDTASNCPAVESAELIWDETELSHPKWEARREYVPIWQGRYGFNDLGKTASLELVDILDKHRPRK